MTKEIETYNRTKLGKMCEQISTEADVNKCKEYIKQYFFHTNHGVFYHNVKESQFEYLDATSTKGGALPSFLRNGFQGKYYCQESAKLNTFKARQWFLDEYYDTYEMVMELGSKPIDHEKMTINMMGALKWGDGSTSQYVPSAKAQHGVDLMLAHIKEVWCSSNEQMYEYVLNWLSCTGRRKLKTFGRGMEEDDEQDEEFDHRQHFRLPANDAAPQVADQHLQLYHDLQQRCREHIKHQLQAVHHVGCQ